MKLKFILTISLLCITQLVFSATIITAGGSIKCNGRASTIAAEIDKAKKDGKSFYCCSETYGGKENCVRIDAITIITARDMEVDPGGGTSGWNWGIVFGLLLIAIAIFFRKR